MFDTQVVITYKHLLIIILMLFAYWNGVDRINQNEFKNELEYIIKREIPKETVAFIKIRPHLISGVISLTSGIIMNGIPVRQLSI